MERQRTSVTPNPAVLATTDRAIACYRQGHIAEATRLAQSVVQAGAGPRETAVCLQLLGLLAHQAGRYVDAIAHFQQAIAVQPGISELKTCLCDAHTAQARRLRKQSQLHEAELHAREALKWQPESPDSLNVLGVLLHERHKFAEARTCFFQGIRDSPQHPQLQLNVANLLSELEEWDAAIEHYKRAVELRPDDVRTLLSAAGAMGAAGRHTGGIQLLEKALQLAKGNAEVHFNLANTYVRIHQSAKAVQFFENALQLRPAWPVARANWVRQRAEICDWRNEWDEQLKQVIHELENHSNESKPFPLNSSQTPGLPIPRGLMRQIACRETDCARRSAEWLNKPQPPSGNVTSPLSIMSVGTRDDDRPLDRVPLVRSEGQRLRLGYLSHDLRHHAIGHLTSGLFSNHDRSRFEVFTYSLGPDDHSEYRQRISAGSEHFNDLVGFRDNQIIARIREDQIDVLVDLQGYSAPSCREC